MERERGITVKAQSVSVLYQFKGEEYILNLIDTPGWLENFKYSLPPPSIFLLILSQEEILYSNLGKGSREGKT